MDAQLYTELLVYLLKTGVRPLKEGEWPAFPSGSLIAEPLSSHEKAAELLQRAGVLQLADGASTEWGPFVLLTQVSEIPLLELGANAPSLDELLGGFVGMCCHCVGPHKVQPIWENPFACHVDDSLIRLLMETGRLVRNDRGSLCWTPKMTAAMVAEGEFDGELDC